MNRDRAWDILLAVLTITVAALGYADPQSAPVWVAVAALLLVLLVLHSQRAPALRQQVRDYRNRLFATPNGWKYQGGANEAQMAALQRAYDDAIGSLGVVTLG